MYCSSGPKVGLTSAKESRNSIFNSVFKHNSYFNYIYSRFHYCLRVGVWKCPKSGSQHWRQHETTQQNTKKKKKMIWKPVKVAWEDLFHRLIMQCYLVLGTQAEEKLNLSMPPCGSVWILMKHWHITIPEPAVHPDSRLPSVSFKCWLFVLDVRVKCCGKKTGRSRKTFRR